MEEKEDKDKEDGLELLLAEEDVDVEDADALNTFLGDSFAVAFAGGKRLGDEKEYVAHAEDAIDYEDEDELAEDDEQADRDRGDGGHDKDDENDDNGNDDEDDWLKELGTVKEEKIKEEDDAVATDVDMDDVDNFGASTATDFMTAVTSSDTRPLRMTAMFAPEPVKLTLPRPRAVKPCVPTRVNLDAAKDQRKLFRAHNFKREPDTNTVVITQTRTSKRVRREKRAKLSAFEKQLIFSSYDWEHRILDSDSDDARSSSSSAAAAAFQGHNDDLLWVDDDEYVSGVDDDAILESNLTQADKVVLDLSDTRILVHADRKHRKQHSDQRWQRYNVSNDAAYDLLKQNYNSRVRATIGNLTIDHATVANRLQSPYYKVNLSKSQARSFHRPNFVIRPNTVIHFSKTRHRKKKKVLATSKDLSLGDGSQFVLLEYAEEYPMVLSNFGMGSKLINYYRKTSPEDDSRPKLAIGETYVLGPQDRSPFWNFGSVGPGEIVPTLYNRLVRAPVFKHEPASTDFLMIRSTGGGEGQKYFFRPISHLYTVGQTLPVTEIPSPRSRRVTTASKNRLKMVVYRVLHRSEKERILVKGIASHFPDQNDMQNRQRLKEFMEYQRTGDDQGYWKVKSSDVLPSYEGIRAMLTPEEITLLETMQAGQQFLKDAGYGEQDEDQNDGMSLEEKLAPWITSKNFINATQGKAMLELYGDGDPSGKGYMFSLIRTSMKGGFRPAGQDEVIDKAKFGGHSYNVAMQQKAYEQEIVRIWNAQKASLSAKPGETSAK